MHQDGTTELRLGAAGVSTRTAEQRAHVLLEVLRPFVAYDGAWVGVVDPVTHDHRRLASTGLDSGALHLGRGPRASGSGGADGPSTTARTPPGAPGCGPRDTLVLTRLAAAGRDVGVLALRFEERRTPSVGTLRRLRELAPLVADSIDPMASALAAAQLVPGARAGALLITGGGCLPLPAGQPEPLLAPGSPVVDAAHDLVEGGAVFASFLWPSGGPAAPEAHVRITVLPAPADAPPGSVAVIASAVETRLRGLTPRELHLLGHLVEGSSNQEIARSLVIAPRTVATHVEHILRKLDAPTRTLAAVRAEQSGLYVPVRACSPTTARPPGRGLAD